MYIDERNEEEWKKIPKWLESGTKDSIFRKLERTQLANLPFSTQKVQITTKVLDYLRNDNFLISQCIGGGRARELACNDKNRHLKLLPWGGVAAHVIDETKDMEPDVGRAFCFLPLPVITGLPLHINGKKIQIERIVLLFLLMISKL